MTDLVIPAVDHGDPEPPRRGANPAPGPGVGRSAVALVDAGVVALALLLAATVAFDTTTAGRGPLALVFFAAVPGWCAARLAGAHLRSLTLLAAVGTSIGATFVTGQALIAWGWWAWRPGTVLACLVAIAISGRDLAGQVSTLRRARAAAAAAAPVVTVDAVGTGDDGAASDPGSAQGWHLERSSAALLVNLAATGGLGALFWLLAARLFPTEAVGPAVAASSLLISLAFVGQLNLGTALSRFLPTAGPQQRSMVLNAYVIAALASTASGAAAGAVLLSRDGLLEGATPGLVLALVLSTPVWVLFTLQDNVLVAVRRPQWVPIENAVASVAKLAVLPVCVGLGSAGVLVAWTAPAVPLVAGVTVVLVRRFLHPATARLTTVRPLLGYALRDLPGTVMFVLSLRLVPLVVLGREGAAEAAHLGVPWTILTVAALVLPSLSRSLLAELSHDDTDDDALYRRAVRLVLTVLTPAVLVGFVAAGPVLAIAGGAYESRGQAVLAWGLLGLVPAALIECELAVLRFRNQLVVGTIIQSGRAVALLAAAAGLIATGRPELLGAAFLVVGLLTLGVVALVRRSVRPAQVARLLPLAAGSALAAWAIATTDPAGIGRTGLIDALPLTYFVAVAAIVVGLFVCLGVTRWAVPATLAHVGALIVVLHGLPAFVEPNPRFPVAWLHTGFVDQLAANGELLPALDARFSWAGFFAGNALIEQAGATGAPVWLIAFTPVVVNAAACWAIWVLGKAVRSTVRQRLCALPVFVISNWVGQDYFSPQATNFVLFLIVLAVVVTCFGTTPAPGSRLHRWLRPAPVETVPVQGRRAVVAYAAILVVIAAIVVSHQLTPFFLAAGLIALGFTRTIRPRLLGLATAAGAATWIAFSAEAYWIGHWDKLIGSAGALDHNLQRNVADRAAGADAARQLVLNARIGLAVALWALAIVALVVAWRRRALPITLLCLLIVPFPLLAMQSYGGEMILRVHLFTLPAAALLVGRLAAPAGRELAAWRRALVAVVLIAAVPPFVVARFGNERFEQVTDDDLAAVEALYDAAPDGAVVYVFNGQTITYTERLDQVRFARFATTRPTPEEAARELRGQRFKRPTYLLLTPSQIAYEEQVRGREDGWAGPYITELLGQAPFTVVARSGSAVVLETKEATR